MALVFNLKNGLIFSKDIIIESLIILFTIKYKSLFLTYLLIIPVVAAVTE